ncbi:MAG: hypothetical protein ACRBCT_04830 [Alphaproteobacteria bacterium]
MGSLTSATNLIGTAAGFADTAIQNEQSQRQLEAQHRLQEQQIAADNALQKAQIDLASAQSEIDRKSALKRAVARQNALTGASGIVSGDGSSEAVILGLYNESEEEAAQREELDTLKKASLNQTLSQRQSLNLLQRNQLNENSRTRSALSAFGGLF